MGRLSFCSKLVKTKKLHELTKPCDMCKEGIRCEIMDNYKGYSIVSNCGVKKKIAEGNLKTLSRSLLVPTYNFFPNLQSFPINFITSTDFFQLYRSAAKGFAAIQCMPECWI